MFSGWHAASDIVPVLACGREMIASMKSWQRTLYLLELKKTRDYPVGVTLSASMSVLPSFSDLKQKKKNLNLDAFTY